jgi:hypothetical protein
METFTLGWGRNWLVRLFGRNELVRSSDRLESVVAALAVITVVLAVPVVAAFGTWVKDARSSVYLQQAQSRHETTATAIEDATLHVQVYSQRLLVQARWPADGRIHVATVTPPEMVRAGDRFDIWVDERGNHVGAPSPLGQAASDAIGASVLTWLAAAGVLAAAVSGLHWRLNRSRYRDWDRALAYLAGNDGGRAHR